MKDKFPEKVIEMDQVRINRGLEKICKCEKRKFLIDTQNRRVTCASCGAVVDGYDAVYEIAMHRERFNDEVKALLEQRKQIINYKPWLLTIRKLESKYRGQKTIPCCPRCDEPFYLDELVTWMGKPYADARIKRFKEIHED